MRKAVSFLLSACLFAGLTACGNQPEAASTGSATPAAGGEQVVKLGLTQFVEHPALDAIRQGIVDGLKESGYEDGKNVELDYQNAHGDMNNTVSIAQKYAGDGKDLVIAIATPSAQAAAKAITDKPVVFSSVTDPLSAQLVSSLEKPDKNVTGTSDKVSMEQQLKLVKTFLPELKKLGVIYTTSEVNSEVQVKELEEAAKKEGIEVVKAGISQLSEVQLAAQGLAGKTDAMFIPIDNTVVSSFEAVLGAAEQNKIPVFASDTDTVKRGAVATYGIDYYQIGKQTGEMASRILKGQKVADTPVEVSKQADLYINEKAAETFGLTVPEALKSQAKEIVK
ncbi:MULTISPECIES: ABC transporter substrate-binding protein [Brevibacillus]|jgi:putative ABC transport system substrate-binding protein|uniref:ABC transporter substrate-binding protein n=1 Tax=Brevibacillus TaxID=55080 RepID=UPI000468EB27|nr:ABC transporter substrate-binding protein [Brevibacillus borstelensis]KKX52672.1 sugar ABC transporter substrate-binding protein [Brevibacillus borstelensis cifa_chp40]MBE5394300.1 ABC transporter substrate-binding protein [Brevibacillus borstelensis]MCC0565241.1 ABC transporter substrate-binding protein [Brevibacillus borstelensis]MCM3471957.1 ABC transporter substrate-binding protein [Brevibacillus borstelensis]MCM3559808.1 ABC transporter substrate-binding protein [Brevibacillus borstele